VVIVDFSQTSATADKAFKARGGFVAPVPWSAGLPAGFSSLCKIQ
jgi:hypothetical protein